MERYNYLIRRKVFKLLGAALHIYDAEGNLIGYARQKAFKLKEDIRVYDDETMMQERILIKARQVIDFSAAYDIYDSATGALYGTWQRKGFHSLMRDNWILLSANGTKIGELQEDDWYWFRRILTGIVPQSFSLRYTNQGIVVNYKQRFNLCVLKLEVTVDKRATLLPQLILAGGVLLATIEGRQHSY